MRSRRPAVRVQRRLPPGRRIDPKTAPRVRLMESQTRRKTSAISSLACGTVISCFPRQLRRCLKPVGIWRVSRSLQVDTYELRSATDQRRMFGLLGGPKIPPRLSGSHDSALFVDLSSG
jgi:hypothetical protein